jgi:hypothetical protein
MRRASWLDSLEERDHTEGLGVWDDNFKMNLGEIGLEGVDWIYLARDKERWRALVTWH